MATDSTLKSYRRRGVRILAVAMTVSALCIAGWFAYDRWLAPGAAPSEELYPLRGVDVSAHNGDIDFGRLRRDSVVHFVYIKATEGTDFLDRNFITNWRGAATAGIPAGAYHFFRFDTDGELQAINFLWALRGRHFDLVPAIDIEEWGNPDGHATARIVERLRIMITYLEAHGVHPMLYTNKDGYYRFIRGNFDSYPLWICSFSDPPLEGNAPWTLWQYSHRGRIDGIPSTVDLNCASSAANIFTSPSKGATGGVQ